MLTECIQSVVVCLFSLGVIVKLYSVIVAIPGSQVINLFHANSAEHEIFSANKYENANNSWHFHIY